MGFNVNKFKSAPLEAAFEKDGEKLHLWIDADIITPNFLGEIREMVRREQSEKGETDLDSQTENLLFMAKVLSQVIRRWDAENDGSPIAPTFDFFSNMPVLMLGELFTFVMQQLAPKKTIEPTSDDITLQVED